MFKKALALIMIVTGAGMVGLLSPGPVDADQHSATRSFSTADGGRGRSVRRDDRGRRLRQPFGQLVETLPAGFSYVAGSVTPSEVGVEVAGQEVRFSLFGESPSPTPLRPPTWRAATPFTAMCLTWIETAEKLGAVRRHNGPGRRGDARPGPQPLPDAAPRPTSSAPPGPCPTRRWTLALSST